MHAIAAQSHLDAKPVGGVGALVAEANHRIANSLTLLVSMVRMQARTLRSHQAPMSPADVRLMLDAIAARINTIGQLHRLLSQVAGDGVTNLGPHLQDVTRALVAALSCEERSVRVEYGGGDCMILMRQLQPIILITCEIFINAMKYAHPNGAPLVMTLDCRATGDGRLMLTIGDDGVGLPEGFDLMDRGGMGFKVMRSLAAEIGAQFQIVSCGKGLHLRLLLPACGTTSDKLS